MKTETANLRLWDLSCTSSSQV